jgi:hypothetical protein
MDTILNMFAQDKSLVAKIYVVTVTVDIYDSY